MRTCTYALAAALVCLLPAHGEAKSLPPEPRHILRHECYNAQVRDAAREAWKVPYIKAYFMEATFDPSQSLNPISMATWTICWNFETFTKMVDDRKPISDKINGAMWDRIKAIARQKHIDPLKLLAAIYVVERIGFNDLHPFYWGVLD